MNFRPAAFSELSVSRVRVCMCACACVCMGWVCSFSMISLSLSFSLSLSISISLSLSLSLWCVCDILSVCDNLMRYSATFVLGRQARALESKVNCGRSTRRVGRVPRRLEMSRVSGDWTVKSTAPLSHLQCEQIQVWSGYYVQCGDTLCCEMQVCSD